MRKVFFSRSIELLREGKRKRGEKTGSNELGIDVTTGLEIDGKKCFIERLS